MKSLNNKGFAIPLIVVLFLALGIAASQLSPKHWTAKDVVFGNFPPVDIVMPSEIPKIDLNDERYEVWPIYAMDDSPFLPPTYVMIFYAIQLSDMEIGYPAFISCGNRVNMLALAYSVNDGEAMWWIYKDGVPVRATEAEVNAYTENTGICNKTSDV